jgi:hypothetical protein
VPENERSVLEIPVVEVAHAAVKVGRLDEDSATRNKPIVPADEKSKRLDTVEMFKDVMKAYFVERFRFAPEPANVSFHIGSSSTSCCSQLCG